MHHHKYMTLGLLHFRSILRRRLRPLEWPSSESSTRSKCTRSGVFLCTYGRRLDFSTKARSLLSGPTTVDIIVLP